MLANSFFWLLAHARLAAVAASIVLNTSLNTMLKENVQWAAGDKLIKKQKITYKQIEANQPTPPAI